MLFRSLFHNHLCVKWTDLFDQCSQGYIWVEQTTPLLRANLFPRTLVRLFWWKPMRVRAFDGQLSAGTGIKECNVSSGVWNAASYWELQHCVACTAGVQVRETHRCSFCKLCGNISQTFVVLCNLLVYCELHITCYKNVVKTSLKCYIDSWYKWRCADLMKVKWVTAKL